MSEVAPPYGPQYVSVSPGGVVEGNYGDDAGEVYATVDVSDCSISQVAGPGASGTAAVGRVVLVDYWAPPAGPKSMIVD